MFLYTFICYNANMKDIRQLVKDIMQPAFDKIIDNTVTVINGMAANMKEIPLEEQERIFKQLLSSTADHLTNTIKSVTPEDIGNKIKGVYNGK